MIVRHFQIIKLLAEILQDPQEQVVTEAVDVVKGEDGRIPIQPLGVGSVGVLLAILLSQLSQCLLNNTGVVDDRESEKSSLISLDLREILSLTWILPLSRLR